MATKPLPVKLSADTALQGVLGVIEDALRKQDVFSNPSLAFYGVDLTFKIELKFYSRGTEDVTVRGSSTLIDEGVLPSELKDGAPLVVEGSRSAGSKVKPQKGTPDYTPGSKRA